MAHTQKYFFIIKKLTYRCSKTVSTFADGDYYVNTSADGLLILTQHRFPDVITKADCAEFCLLDELESDFYAITAETWCYCIPVLNSTITTGLL